MALKLDVRVPVEGAVELGALAIPARRARPPPRYHYGPRPSDAKRAELSGGLLAAQKAL